MFDKFRRNIASSILGYNPFRQNLSINAFNTQWINNKPSWISLSTPDHFEKAVRFNPVVKACINLLSISASNGRKYLEDTRTGEEIPWTSNRAAVKNAFRLFNQFPNPMQSSEEFNQQRIFYLKTFGNSFVYLNSPFADIDIYNIQTMVNLPVQFTEVKLTGKIYDQIRLDGIISEYALNNYNPPRRFNPNEIIHFNEVNISTHCPSVMGISKLEVLKQPISNVQRLFEFMNTLYNSRGMGGIISPNSKDANGTITPTPTEKKDLDNTFKKDYGYLNDQNPFLISPVPLDYIKTVMSPKDIGVYEDFSNNAIIISNEFNIPPELVKTYIQGATYENQLQSVKRLYQNAAIPMVEGEDKYWSYRLNTRKYGFIIKTKWDHVPALQDNFKEKAISISTKGRTAKEAYDLDIITWNQYLNMIELPSVPDGDVLKSERKTIDPE